MNTKNSEMAGAEELLVARKAVPGAGGRIFPLWSSDQEIFGEHQLMQYAAEIRLNTKTF